MGVPGFPGINGIPGVQGPPGSSGLSGRDGCNGTDVSLLVLLFITLKKYQSEEQIIEMSLFIILG